MKKVRARLLIFSLSCLLLACGYKTHPRPAAATVPSEVRFVYARAYPDRVVLKWDVPTSNTNGSALKDLAGFRVYRAGRKVGEECEDCENAGQFYAHINYDPQKAAQSKEASFLDRSIEVGQVYYYSVSAYNLQGREGDRSSNVIVSLDGFPPAPRGLRASYDARGIALTWDAPIRPAGIRSYQVYRGDTSDPADMRPIGRTKWATTSYVDGKVQKDETYFYQVRSMKMNEGTSLESNASATVKATYPRVKWEGPENVNVERNRRANSIAVVWDPVKIPDEETRYNLYRSENEKEFVKLNSKPIANVMYADSTVRKGRKYRYAVTAFAKGTPEEESSRSASELITIPSE